MQKLPSLSEFQQMQTDLELQSITHNKLSHQIQDIRQELEKKSSQLSNSQREALNLKLQVNIKNFIDQVLSLNSQHKKHLTYIFFS